MGKIVAVHGVGQQFKGDAIIHREWWPACKSGLHLAARELADEREFICPFYGHLFRPAGTLGISDQWKVSDIEPEEAQLLEMMWNGAAEAEPGSVAKPATYPPDKSLARAPQLLQYGLNALSRSKFWATVSRAALIGDLKQVVRYFNDAKLRENILKTVTDKITTDTRVMIGHSLGSVAAYEAVCRKPENIVSFVSLGSPLGIRNLIFDKLVPAPDSKGIGAWPGRVQYWTNIADKGDVVALQKELALLFGSKVKDVLVYNGSDAHHGERYLTTKEAGEAIAAGL